MSTDWDLHCVTCNEDLGLGWNHGTKELRQLWQAAPRLIELLPIGDLIQELEIGSYLGNPAKFGHVQWMAEHLRHEVVLKSEYDSIATGKPDRKDLPRHTILADDAATLRAENRELRKRLAEEKRGSLIDQLHLWGSIIRAIGVAAEICLHPKRTTDHNAVLTLAQRVRGGFTRTAIELTGELAKEDPEGPWPVVFAELEFIQSMVEPKQQQVFVIPPETEKSST